MIIHKVTVGFVVQRFDTEKRRFVGQDFIAEDGHTWENEHGEPLDDSDDKDSEAIYGKGGVDEPVLALEMVQPNRDKDHIKRGDKVIATNDAGVEFQATVKGWRQGLYITVEDQDGDCWDCDPADVELADEEKDRTKD